MRGWTVRRRWVAPLTLGLYTLVLGTLGLGLGACGDAPSTLSTCYLDGLAAADVSGVGYVDCGSFARGSELYTDAAMVSAQNCVLNAIRREQGFLLLYDANDSAGQAASGSRAGYTGAVRDGKLLLNTYAGQGDPATPTAMDFVTRRSCLSLEATPDCKPAVGVPCLQCVSTDLGNIACRG